jgi:hypothetical protein
MTNASSFLFTLVLTSSLTSILRECIMILSETIMHFNLLWKTTEKKQIVLLFLFCACALLFKIYNASQNYCIDRIGVRSREKEK